MLAHLLLLASVCFSACWSSLAPRIMEISPMNAPTVGGKIVTIYGENFGDKSEGLSIDIRGFPCPEVVLQSPTRALCEVPPGLGTGHEFILTTMDGTQVVKSTSAPSAKFSYDAPYVNIVMPGNGPTTGGTQITVSGKNFGMAINHPNPEVTIGGKNCLQSIWEHDGKVKCVAPSGIGIGNVVVYLQGQQSQPGYDTIYEYDHSSPQYFFVTLCLGTTNPSSPVSPPTTGPLVVAAKSPCWARISACRTVGQQSLSATPHALSPCGRATAPSCARCLPARATTT